MYQQTRTRVLTSIISVARLIQIRNDPPDDLVALNIAVSVLERSGDSCPIDGGSMEQGRRGKVSRRELLALGAAVGTAAAAEALSRHDGMLGGPSRTYTNALPWGDGLTDAPDAALDGGWRYLNSGEAGFLTAAVDRLIPADPTGPSASETGVVIFLDRQLAGDYGNGAHFYLEGPWATGTESQGFQSRFTPAQFYRHAIAAIEQSVGRLQSGKLFKDLSADVQDGLLKQMESGTLKLSGPITSKAFFTMFLQNVLEGYFSDPIYGGNKGGAAWKMIGFPGAHYDYSEWVTAYNQLVPVETVGLRGRSAWLRS
jgi:gluconate 2-dehydrogenase gamma chain